MRSKTNTKATKILDQLDRVGVVSMALYQNYCGDLGPRCTTMVLLIIGLVDLEGFYLHWTRFMGARAGNVCPNDRSSLARSYKGEPLCALDSLLRQKPYCQAKTSFSSQVYLGKVWCRNIFHLDAKLLGFLLASCFSPGLSVILRPSEFS
jgi:hypothetical protein